MKNMNQALAHSSRGRSSRKPKTRGIYVLLDTGPERRAILYSEPDPVKKGD